MGMRMPETCRVVFKRQVINLRTYCILLVDSVEGMMMHGLANVKCYSVFVDGKHTLLAFLTLTLFPILPTRPFNTSYGTIIAFVIHDMTLVLDGLLQ